MFTVDDHRFVFLQIELVIQFGLHIEQHDRIGKTGDRRSILVSVAELIWIVFESPDVVRRKNAHTRQIEQLALQPAVVHLASGDDNIVAIQCQITVLLLAKRTQRHVNAD